MDGPLKELAKIEKLADRDASGKLPAIQTSLDALLHSLNDAKDRIQANNVSPDTYALLVQSVDARKKDIDDKQKELYNAIAKLGKALDKKFPTALPSYDPLFASDNSRHALEHTIALHFLRTGQFSTAETFIQECGLDIAPERRSHFLQLHHILTALRNHDISSALEWCSHNRPFLHARSSPLEFHLHRSQFVRLLLANHPPDPDIALGYAKTAMQAFFVEHASEFQRLMGALLYLPIDHLQRSPYADLASPTLHLDLIPLFAKEYCASLGMSRQLPLSTIGDIGGGGALARIEKAKSVMRERKSEWSQSNELPVRYSIEIPLPPENRYHSIFACPVSKEQSTEANPPMMMACGHVISKESLGKLNKSSGRVKCPYCPMESAHTSAIRVHF
ncbi:hypothetical protein CONPUDRAFT_48700 [Coniophora puteana RWD-64-598 SS2]|uniref:GID complex catalytic subunit 2 n=1 Tax=Coniophora puteana (strain RWD-64-598) TaxID=741705 RepID=A0A5M3N2T8_CONPW|nr:uncharacterized protein CONPUDRAFT_48700 [Coniophora puteana RWD-64-598 SS2]EIW85231.1 hypothetical protein CONPUDRAFT_48700 [Coniophora puteana RWD-64-598 SS2]